MRFNHHINTFSTDKHMGTSRQIVKSKKININHVQSKVKRRFHSKSELPSDLVLENEDVELEMAIEAAQTLKANTRPLLQLLSEDYPSPVVLTESLHTETEMVSLNQSQVYQDINLSSEEDDIDVPCKVLEKEDTNHITSEHRLSNLSRFVWSPKSTNILLKLWEKNLIGLRDDLKKNSEIHKEMAMDMAAYGPTAKEIKTKMDNMLRKYRVEIEKMKKTNTTTSSWRYFKIIQTFLNEDPAADFEEIIFDDQESSTFYKSDECDDNISIVNVTNPPSEENFQTDTEPEPEIKDEHHSYPQLQRRTNVEEYHSPLRTAKKSKNRLMEIEEEKLTIEKQKLLVMKHISRDLTSISKTLIELLRNSNNKVQNNQ